MTTVYAKRPRSRKRVGPEVTQNFDAEGVRRAMLAALEGIYENFPHITLAQYLVAFEILVAEADGQPHTLVSLVKKLNMPFSTASRVVWSLTIDGGDVGMVKYRRHPTDRRKKLLVMERDHRDCCVPHALDRALVDYYGESVHKLKRAAH